MMDKTKTAILEAAFGVFAKTPTATLSDVAEAAGIGRATLHRHFSGRDDLIQALAHAAASELDAAIAAATQDAPSYTEALRLSLEAMIPLAERQFFLANEPLGQMSGMAEIYARQQSELADAIDAVKAEGGFDPALPTPWIVQAYETATYSAWALVDAEEATPRQASAFAWRLLQSGLKGTSA